MDRKEFETIYRQHYAAMYRLARTMLYDKDESHDVVDEVFTRLLQGGAASPGDDKVEGYLMTSVRNRCRDILRHKTIREEVHALFAKELKAGQSSDTDDDERLERLYNFIDKGLPEMTKRIFRLRFIDDMTYDEIAKAEGVSRVTVYNHLSKAISLIHNYFGNE